ncbi:hypothetical protein [Pseudomonas sp. MWU13-3659]|uniref:hypothetical protein n=1 Tax=Pseudomonas sp. MWU13-3659 TaxID=2986964 RepID=UPI0020761FBB|nr:hypothetical protein [Pseudomonas sp. MWU13-3659]
MPTENRSSNAEMVSVPRQLTREMLNGVCMHPDLARSLWSALLKNAPQPAEQNQSEPVAWRGINELGEIVTEWVDGSPPKTMVDLSGNHDSYASIELAYTRAAPGEVERLRSEIKRLELMVSQSDYSYDMDRDHMKGRINSLEDLMRKFVHNCKKHQLQHTDLPALSGVRWYLKRFESALSASAAPQVKS